MFIENFGKNLLLQIISTVKVGDSICLHQNCRQQK